MLRIHVVNSNQNRTLEHARGPLEIGRGPPRGTERFIVADPTVSRDQLRIHELPGMRVRVLNLSRTNVVMLDGGAMVAPGSEREIPLPASLVVGETRLQITGEPAPV